MKRLLAVGLVLVAAYWAVRSGLFAPTFFLGGIQVNEADHARWVEALDEAGMNTVAVTVYAKQGDWDSSNLWFEDEEPWVVHEVRTAKERGLKAVLVLRVALDHAFERNRFFWHGMIMPESDEMLVEWFRRYREFAVKWAEIAEAEGIDVLAIASEMNSLTNTVFVTVLPALEEYWANDEKVANEQAKVRARVGEIEERHLWLRGNVGYEALGEFLDDEAAAHRAWAIEVGSLDTDDPIARINERRDRLREAWIGLIHDVRRVYSGSLTYAANFDQYESVDFWPELDLIGINAYFPLRRRVVGDGPSEDLAPLLEARWLSILRSVDRFRAQGDLGDHRVLLTELGYVRRRNSTIEPWAATGFSVLPSAEGSQLVVWEDQPEDRVERAMAVRGLYEANLALGGDLLAGLLYWKLSTEPAHEAVEPFALIIGESAPWDPLRDELGRFSGDLPLDRFKRRLTKR